jgi:hypothetical protein
MSIRVTNGFISRVRAGPVEQSFARDRLDRLTNLVWRVQDTPVLEIRYTLDLLGRVTQRVDRSGGAVLAVRDYGYDGLDRVWCKYSNALLRQWILGIVEMIRAKTTHPKFADFAMWPQQKE